MIDILLVEDNRELSGLLSRFLAGEGYTILAAGSAEEAVKIWNREKARLVILDVMLPGRDGLYVCAKIRETDNVPIIFLSAVSDRDTKLKSFQLGADDFVEKPVDIDLLIAKTAAVWKRNYEISDRMLLSSGELQIDLAEMEVFLQGRKLTLTAKEYDLLVLFAENPGRALSKEYLFSSVWGCDSDSENQTLTVHVKMLRDKIEKDPRRPERICTVWGTGYRYEKI